MTAGILLIPTLGGDMHVSAQFADAHRTINGSLFFSHDNIPTTLAVQDICQLVAVEMQEWNGSAQLSGRNVQIVEVVPGDRKVICHACIILLPRFCDHRKSAEGSCRVQYLNIGIPEPVTRPTSCR